MKRRVAMVAPLLLVGGICLAEDRYYQLQVDGLVCPFCAYNIEKNVGNLEGVKGVKANLKDGLVSVLVADGRTLDEERVRQTIKDAGFTLRAIEPGEPAAP